MYNYSVIIPHKNTPDLLKRCLYSIPERDDLQVVVVDDNSDADKVDFSDFPGIRRTEIELYLSKGKEGKGPGFARNKGMSLAKGKWIIFADADDYFSTDFTTLLDRYVDADEDILFFKCLRHNLSGVVRDYPLINDAMDAAMQGNTDAIVYGVPCPWGKFIQRDFLVRNKIRYQEITGGDDILFSIFMGLHVQSFQLLNDRLYCVVDRPGSLTRNTDWQSFWSYSGACVKAYGLLKRVDKEPLAVSWLISWWGFLWADHKFRALCFIPRIVLQLRLRDAVRVLRKGIKRGSWKWDEN
jgi:glycosyltransferase involved in cell wall biosynthesis